MPLLLEPLIKLFNLIFMKGTFPKAWNESFITLTHKKGNKSNNSNYRGISITSNLGKLFNKIIHARLLKFIGSNNLMCENQIGFKENCRTADCIFSLKSLVDHYTAKKRRYLLPLLIYERLSTLFGGRVYYMCYCSTTSHINYLILFILCIMRLNVGLNSNMALVMISHQLAE